MRPLYTPTISDGVLLARLGDVHRQAGRETACGQRCRDCYPDHHHSHKLPQPVPRIGRRAA